MTLPRLKHIAMILQWACAAMGVGYIGLFIFVAAQTLHYPFHIEWMEGQVIDVIARVRAGLPIYDKPSIDYVAFAYTPYFYYLSAFVSLFTGVDFIAGRLVSFMAALATGVIIYQWISKEGGRPVTALTAAGGFYATYIITGRWMDVSRVDSLFLCLTLLGLYVFYFYRPTCDNKWHYRLLTAAIMTAACFTKQTSAIAMAPAFGAMLIIDWRHSIYTALLVFISVIVLSAIGHAMTDGWSTFFIYQLEAGHGIQWHQLKGFWVHDLLPHVGIMLCIALYGIILTFQNHKHQSLWYLSLTIGFIGCSYAARLNWGGYLNVLMPACCMISLLLGITLTRLQVRQTNWISLSVLVLVVIQFIALMYNPYRYIPTQASIDVGNRFLRELSKIEGEVFIPEVQFVQTRIGKKSYTLGMAALDVIATDMKEKNHIKRDLLLQIRNAIQQQKFAAVMPGGVVPVPQVRRYYQQAYGLSYPKEYVSETRNFLRRTIMLPRDIIDSRIKRAP